MGPLHERPSTHVPNAELFIGVLTSLGLPLLQATFAATPAPGNAYVRNVYCGINASDINYTNGKYFPGVQPPFDTGFEAIGRIVGLGDGVTKFKIGDPVSYMGYGLSFLTFPSTLQLFLSSSFVLQPVSPSPTPISKSSFPALSPPLTPSSCRCLFRAEGGLCQGPHPAPPPSPRVSRPPRERVDCFHRPRKGLRDQAWRNGSRNRCIFYTTLHTDDVARPHSVLTLPRANAINEDIAALRLHPTNAQHALSTIHV